MFRKFKSNKAQVSMEYLLVFGFAMFLAMSLITVYITQQDNIETDVAVSQAERALQDIVFSAEEVYFMGTGSQKTTQVQLPPRIQEIEINANFISMDMRGGSGTISLSQSTNANMTGNISYYEGKHTLVFKNVGGQVEIYEK